MTNYTENPNKPFMETPTEKLPPFLCGWVAAAHRNGYRIYGGHRYPIAKVYGPPEKNDKEFRHDIEQAVTAMENAPDMLRTLMLIVEQVQAGYKPDLGHAMALISRVRQGGVYYLDDSTESGDSPI